MIAKLLYLDKHIAYNGYSQLKLPKKYHTTVPNKIRHKVALLEIFMLTPAEKR